MKEKRSCTGACCTTPHQQRILACIIVLLACTRANAAELDAKTATQMVESAIRGIWSFDLKVSVVVRAYLSPEYATENGKRVHVRNKKLREPQVSREEFRQVYRQEKSRIEFLKGWFRKANLPPPIMVCDGEFEKMWNPERKQCMVQPISINLAPLGRDYRDTYGNIYGTIRLMSCVRERNNVVLKHDAKMKSRIVLEIPPVPPETAAAFFDTAFQVTVDPDKGFLPVKIEHLQPVQGKLVREINGNSDPLAAAQRWRPRSYASPFPVFRHPP